MCKKHIFCEWCHNTLTYEAFVAHFKACLDADLRKFKLKVLAETGIDLDA